MNAAGTGWAIVGFVGVLAAACGSGPGGGDAAGPADAGDAAPGDTDAAAQAADGAGSDGGGGGACADPDEVRTGGYCTCPSGWVCAGDCCPAGEVCAGGGCCAPDCGTRTCGDDGCGGTCGSCDADHWCVDGACECPPTTLACDDECCYSGTVCYADPAPRCCVPWCIGVPCGSSDGCGGTCAC